MNSTIIISILVVFLVTILMGVFEKRLKKSNYFHVFVVLIAFSFGGYMIGSAEELSFSGILLIALFFGGGIWQLLRFARLQNGN